MSYEVANQGWLGFLIVKTNEEDEIMTPTFPTILSGSYKKQSTVFSILPKPPVQSFFFSMLRRCLREINGTSESVQYTTVLHHSGIVVGQGKEYFGVFTFQVVNGGYSNIPQVGCKRLAYSGNYHQFLNGLLFGHCV